MANNLAEVTLSITGSVPLIYRQMLIPVQTSLFELHQMVQTIFLWSDSEPFHFVINDEEVRDEDELEDIPLSQVINRKGAILQYVDESADSWFVTIEGQGFRFAEELNDYPLIKDGANAGPPESATSIANYNTFVIDFNNGISQDALNKKYGDWVMEFDPAAFDLDMYNDLLSGHGMSLSDDDMYDDFDEMDGFSEVGEH